MAFFLIKSFISRGFGFGLLIFTNAITKIILFKNNEFHAFSSILRRALTLQRCCFCFCKNIYRHFPLISHINLFLSLCEWPSDKRWDVCVKVVTRTQKSSRFLTLIAGQQVAPVPADDNVIKWLWFTVHNSSTSSHWLRHSHHTLA